VDNVHFGDSKNIGYPDVSVSIFDVVIVDHIIRYLSYLGPVPRGAKSLGDTLNAIAPVKIFPACEGDFERGANTSRLITTKT
jgi:hypothetical protein